MHSFFFNASLTSEINKGVSMFKRVIISLVIALMPSFATIDVGTNFWNIQWGIRDDVFKPNQNWSTTTDPWNPTFIQEISSFKTLRFMDWVPTNGSSVTSWNQRIQKTTDHNGNTDGVAIEWQIDLCNKIGANIWVNIPAMANKDYSTQLATLLKNTLRSDLKIYVEYSNETWNEGGPFTQSQYVKQQGAALGLPGNEWYKGWYYTVYASIRVWETFEEVFGKNNPRIVRVLAGQAGWLGPNLTNGIATEHLAALKNEVDPRINPNNIMPHFYSIAPYMGGSSISDIQNDIVTCQEYWTRLKNSIANAGLSNTIKMNAYEGGQHVTTNAAAVNRDPAIYQVYMNYFNAMNQSMGGEGVFVHYLHSGNYNDGGAWGSKEYVGQPNSEAPKYRALMDWITTNPPTSSSNTSSSSVPVSSSSSSVPSIVPDLMIKTATNPVIIDGTEDPQWSSEIPQKLNNLILGTLPTDLDFSSSFKTLWTQYGLSLWIEVKDDQLGLVTTGELYHSDNVEVYVDGDGLLGNLYDSNTRQIRLIRGSSTPTVSIGSAIQGLSVAGL
jgi:hypothetical protein